ncbi:MAG: PqqD family protein [Elusimicrobia bacterium]|nr:PqqD family protein [Elusimicrobiota bacterium]
MNYAVPQDVTISHIDGVGMAYAFVKKTNKLLFLNQTAAYALSLLAEGFSQDRISEDFQRSFRLAKEDAVRDVAAIISALEGQCIVSPIQ